MQDGISVLGVMGVVRDFVARRRLQSITAMVFMVVTMFFVLAWPTVASAMTGYDSNNVAFIKIRDGSLIRFSSFEPLLYIIHDGSRIDGLTDEYLVPCCTAESKSSQILLFCKLGIVLVNFIPGDYDPTFTFKIAPSCYCYKEDDIYFLGANASACKYSRDSDAPGSF